MNPKICAVIHKLIYTHNTGEECSSLRYFSISMTLGVILLCVTHNQMTLKIPIFFGYAIYGWLLTLNKNLSFENCNLFICYIYSLVEAGNGGLHNEYCSWMDYSDLSIADCNSYNIQVRFV